MVSTILEAHCNFISLVYMMLFSVFPQDQIAAYVEYLIQFTSEQFADDIAEVHLYLLIQLVILIFCVVFDMRNPSFY